MQNITPVDASTPDRITTAFRQNLLKVAEWATCEAVCPAAGDVAKAAHSLGKKPDLFFTVPFVDGRVWVDADDEKSWSDKMIVFHASAAGRYRVVVGRI